MLCYAALSMSSPPARPAHVPAMVRALFEVHHEKLCVPSRLCARLCRGGAEGRLNRYARPACSHALNGCARVFNLPSL